jgi:hypothetical protein
VTSDNKIKDEEIRKVETIKVRCCTLVAKVGSMEVPIRLFTIVTVVTKVRLGLFSWYGYHSNHQYDCGNTYGYHGYHFYAGCNGKDCDNCLAS